MKGKISTATVTFHSAHNYGSVLQAYALQQVIRSLGYDNTIINLRTERQKDSYNIFTKRRGLKYVFKNAARALYYSSLKKRHEKFERFMKEKLTLTSEYASEEGLKNARFSFDCYIAGSDQIWNPVPVDFDWSYYLTFVQEGRRIAYAPSFGQAASLGDAETQRRIATALRRFDSISVREKGSAENVQKLIGREPAIVLDPTLLLDMDAWASLLEGEKPLYEGDYIFFYTLFADKSRMQIVKRISELLGMPVVTSNFSNQYDLFTPFVKRYDAGPLDFLNLVRNARLSVCSSFHGTVFSIIFNTPFLAINGMDDARIATLLTHVGLENRAATTLNVDEICRAALNTDDFALVDERLAPLRKLSIDFLTSNI